MLTVTFLWSAEPSFKLLGISGPSCRGAKLRVTFDDPQKFLELIGNSDTCRHRAQWCRTHCRGSRLRDLKQLFPYKRRQHILSPRTRSPPHRAEGRTLKNCDNSFSVIKAVSSKSPHRRFSATCCWVWVQFSLCPSHIYCWGSVLGDLWFYGPSTSPSLLSTTTKFAAILLIQLNTRACRVPSPQQSEATCRVIWGSSVLLHHRQCSLQPSSRPFFLLNPFHREKV